MGGRLFYAGGNLRLPRRAGSAQARGLLRWSSNSFFTEALSTGDWPHAWLPFTGLAITLASAWRLARFNIDEDQVSSFTGLPTPANALLILSLPLILLYNGSDAVSAVLMNPWVLVGITILSAYLLNAPIRLFALKFDNWSFRDNGYKYIFLILSGVALLTLQFLAVPLIILMYVLFSLFARPE